PSPPVDVRDVVTAPVPEPVVTSVAAGERTRTHFPAFDGLRAVAALLIVVVHTAFTSGFTDRSGRWGPLTARAEIGVAAFFLISGFLLYRPFVNARLAGKPGPSLREFARRRFLRIFPLYWVVLTVVAVLGEAHIHGSQGWVLHYSLLQVDRS